MKNTLGKSRKSDQPYLVFESADGWTWKVLKSWQGDNAKPYARWFCEVSSPMTWGGADLGDTYVSEVVEHGALTSWDLPEGTDLQDVLAGLDVIVAGPPLTESESAEDAGIEAARAGLGLDAAFAKLDEDPFEIDTTSSASRQHFIDTGRYLRKGEAL